MLAFPRCCLEGYFTSICIFPDFSPFAHVCPLQLDIVERIINRYSNEGDMVLDPFGGLMTVPMTAVKMKRYGYGIELSCDYFRDGVGYSSDRRCAV